MTTINQIKTELDSLKKILNIYSCLSISGPNIFDLIDRYTYYNNKNDNYNKYKIITEFKYFVTNKLININIKYPNEKLNKRKFITYATYNGCTEIVKLLLDNDSNLHEFDFYLACEKGFADILYLFLDRLGCRIKGRIEFNLFVYNSSDVLYNEFTNNADFEDFKFRCLLKACEYNRVEVVKILLFKLNIQLNVDFSSKYLNDSATPEIEKMNLLSFVCQRNYFEIAVLLIDSGANLHRKKLKNSTESSPHFPLRYACENNNFKLVELLIKLDVNVNEEIKCFGFYKKRLVDIPKDENIKKLIQNHPNYKKSFFEKRIEQITNIFDINKISN